MQGKLLPNGGAGLTLRCGHTGEMGCQEPDGAQPREEQLFPGWDNPGHQYGLGAGSWEGDLQRRTWGSWCAKEVHSGGMRRGGHRFGEVLIRY